MNSSGPSLAWHTLSPSNPQNALLFGGDPDSNSATVVLNIPDSAQLLNLVSPLQPVWSLEPPSWAGEPIRRMRHSTATSFSGQVFIIGGEMADGSGNAFPDHYVFNPSIPSFTLLPPNGPPDIYGHASIIISDGRLLVFGGYSSSQGTLLPFSTIWVLDTSQPNLPWTVIQTSISLLPSPRMAFAAVSIDDGGILVHGGSDADLQSNFADGWILNTSQSSMSWTQVAALSQLGARRDHFAVCQGDQVLFGFGKCQTLYAKINTYNRINKGYENNGPAAAALQIYNTSSQSFVSLFEPLPPTQTTPTNSQKGKSTNSATSQPPSSSTASKNPNNPGGSGTNNSHSTKTRTIAIGATLGALAVLAILLGSTYYLRRRQHERGDGRFMALGGCDGTNSPHLDDEIPVVDIRGDPVMRTYGGNRGLLTSLGLVSAISAATKMKKMENTYQRRDMLADEDTRSFGEWYTSRSGDGTDGSSWSLKSILGGGTRLLSREASTASRGTNTGSRRNTPWREKIDPFADGTSSQDTNFLGVATASGPTRPRANGRRLMSHASSKSALSYRDPFSDPVQEEPRQRSDASEPFFDNEDHLRLSVRHVPVLPTTIPTRPLSQGSHTLSPLSEHTSHHELTIPEFSAATSSQVHSNETVMTPFGGTSSLSTSRTSVDPLPLSSSVIGTVHNDMRRTDSWWTRFTRTTLLDRRLSDASRMSGTSGRFEIRDPKPPPRLDAIVENIHLASRTENSRPSQEEPLPYQPILGRVASMVYNTGHGKSMSSLRTADSEAIERMAGTMDVFQRINTSNNSHRTTGSINSTGGRSIDTLGSSLDGHDNHVSGSRTSQRIMPDDPLTFSVNTKLFSSPIEILPLQAPGGCDDVIEYSPPRPSSSPLLSTPSPPKDSPIRFISSPPPLLSKNNLISPSSPGVADRIHAFEKGIALEQTSSPLATNKYREERMKGVLLWIIDSFHDPVFLLRILTLFVYRLQRTDDTLF